MAAQWPHTNGGLPREGPMQAFVWVCVITGSGGFGGFGGYLHSRGPGGVVWRGGSGLARTEPPVVAGDRIRPCRTVRGTDLRGQKLWFVRTESLPASHHTSTDLICNTVHCTQQLRSLTSPFHRAELSPPRQILPVFWAASAREVADAGFKRQQQQQQ